MNYDKAHYRALASRKRLAFKDIAIELGESHPIVKMMGSRAWGRHNHEEGASGNLRTAIFEVGSLDGAFDILNTWARDNDRDAQKIMLKIYPLNWSLS